MVGTGHIFQHFPFPYSSSVSILFVFMFRHLYLVDFDLITFHFLRIDFFNFRIRIVRNIFIFELYLASTHGPASLLYHRYGIFFYFLLKMSLAILWKKKIINKKLQQVGKDENGCYLLFFIYYALEVMFLPAFRRVSQSFEIKSVFST